MARDRRSRGWSGTGCRPGTRGGLGTGRGSGLGGRSGLTGGFGPHGVADLADVWCNPPVVVGTVLISAVAVSTVVVSTVVTCAVAVRPGLGALLVLFGDPGSLGLYRGLHPVPQFGRHRRCRRRGGPGVGYTLYALRKLLLGVVFISHSETPTPCATRTREDADRMV
jgi:hypothetical protein